MASRQYSMNINHKSKIIAISLFFAIIFSACRITDNIAGKITPQEPENNNPLKTEDFASPVEENVEVVFPTQTLTPNSQDTTSTLEISLPKEVGGIAPTGVTNNFQNPIDRLEKGLYIAYISEGRLFVKNIVSGEEDEFVNIEMATAFLSPDYTKLVFESTDLQSRIKILDLPSGKLINASIPFQLNTFSTFDWSPNNQWLIYSANPEEPEIRNSLFLYDLTNDSNIQVTRSIAADTNPSWSPKDDWIVFVSDQDLESDEGFTLGKKAIYKIPVGCVFEVDTCSENITLVSAISKNFPDWSPSGDYLVFTCYKDDFYGICISDIYESKVEQIYVSEREIHLINWSPNEKYIAFSLMEIEDNDNVTAYSDVYLLDIDSGYAINITNSPEINEWVMFWIEIK